MATVFSKVAELASTCDRHQFIEFDLPKTLPSLTQLRQAEQVIDQKSAKVFNTPESIVLLQMWEWLGDKRSESFISKIPLECLDRINLIFRESGRWFVVNLATLNNWRKATKEELQKDPTLNDKGHPADRMQKLFIRSVMGLFEARTGAVIEPEQTAEDDDNVLETVTKAQETSSGVGTVIDNEFAQNLDDDSEDKVITTDTEEIPTETHEDLVNLDAQIDADLDTLEDISTVDHEVDELDNIQDQEVFDISTVIPTGQSLEDAIIQRCNSLADSGGLSAAEYRKYLEIAGTYKTIIAPDGSTLDKFIEIPKEVVEIKESASIPDKKTIIDKTMLKSSLMEFNEKYVKEVMQKDIAGMVMNLQKAGIIVLDYQMETVENVSMAYNSYTVKVKPLQGTVSTLRFRIPKVTEDGYWVANGVRYTSRKQKGDLPLRKISPNQVALTSYYGKVFVTRSEKKVNDYGRWLTDAVMLLGLNDDDLITDLVTGNAFESEITVPKLYSTIAKSFRSFTLKASNKNWKLSFEVKKRNSVFGDVDLDYIEKGNNILVGKSEDGQFMVMGANGALYTVNDTNEDSKLTALPPLEEMLGLRLNKAPIEFAELKVFGKAISLGVVLGYLIGLDNLLKILKVTPRIVPIGQRTNLAMDEWSIVFQDETWVFSRDDVLASIVLAGWRDHDTTTSNYSAHEFNRKDVYFNLLEDAGLGVRYMRELDLLNQLFVDPITKELLEQMKEPVEFTKLLLRSGELLTNDQHPYELDPAFMRVKGYERFSGILYSELVRSVRVHNARANKTTAPVELNPYAVWIAINEDSAKNQNLEINPIQNLKETEAVTFSGVGGRTGRSMVKRTRAYHKNDMGTISEATVDSSDVAINTYLSADPQFNSLRGTSNRYEIGKTGATALFSTAALTSVASDRDD